MRTLAEMHDLKNYNLVQATPSSIIVIDVVVLGSITSRCSGNEPALLWKDQGSGGNRSYGSICVLFKYIKKLTKPILLVVFVFRLTQSKAVFVFPQKPPTPSQKIYHDPWTCQYTMVAYVHFENKSIRYLCDGYQSHHLFKKLDLRTISWNVFRRSPGRINIQFAGSCETSSPLLLFVWVARSSSPKMLERFSSLSSIIGNLVGKKRRKCQFHRHKWTRHLIYARACVNKYFFHSDSTRLK